MSDIDGMDMLGYLRVKAWRAKHKQKEKEPKQSTIDQVWPGLKP